MKQPDRARPGPGPGQAPCWSRPRRGSGSTELFEAIVSALPPPDRRPGRAAAGADLRLALRPLPGHGGLLPGLRRPRARRATRSASCPTAPAYKVEEVGIFQLAPGPRAGAARRARWATSSPGSRRSPTRAVRGHHHPQRAALRRAPAGLPGGQAGGLLLHLPGGRRRLRGAGDRPWRSSSSTTPPSSTRRTPRWRWASGSAAASWGCCTWRSCRSGWSASSSCRSILTAPSVRYRIGLRDGSAITIDNPALYPDPTTIESTEEPFIRATIICPERYMGAVMKLCLERRGIEHQLPVPDERPAGDDLRAAAGRGGLRLLRQAQVHHPGLRLLRLRAAATTARPTWSSSTS